MSDERAAVELVCAADVEPKPFEWLWENWLARGKYQVIAGAPATGKTTLALTIAAIVTQGGAWVDGSRSPQGNVLIWSAEDDWADTLVPRLVAAGADLSRVRFVGDVQRDRRSHAFDPATDIEHLKRSAAEIGDVSLLIVDPVVSAVQGDSNKNGDVRRGLQPLVDFARDFNCAVLGVSHFSKGTATRSPVERVTGSLAFAALARLVMATAKRATVDDEFPYLLLRAKSNIGPEGDGYSYAMQQVPLSHIEGVSASRVEWGGVVTGEARALLGEAESDVSNYPGGAAGLLLELLSDGPRSVRDVLSEAEAAGFSRDAMHRAKRKIGAGVTKQGMKGGWAWHLPGGAVSSEDGEGSVSPASPPSPPSKISHGDDAE